MASTDVESVDITTLSDEEKQSFQADKMKKFKFTIIICCIYAFIAFVFLLLGLFTSWGIRFYNKMYSFLITFVIGTIIIVIYLSNEIYNFKPSTSRFKTTYDAEMCPDYWKLDYLKNEDLLDDKGRSFVAKSHNKNHFIYRCSMDNRLFSAQKLIELDKNKKYNMSDDNHLYVKVNQTDSGVRKNDKFDEFKKHAAAMSGYDFDGENLEANNDNALKKKGDEFNANNLPLKCDTVYPMYLSIMDSANSKKDLSEPNNRNRCAYAKSCGVSWTEAGCT